MYAFYIVVGSNNILIVLVVLSAINSPMFGNFAKCHKTKAHIILPTLEKKEKKAKTQLLQYKQ